MSKPNTTIVANSYKAYAVYFGSHTTKQGKAREGKASRCVSQTRQEAWPLVLKTTVFTLLTTAYDIFDQICYLKCQQTRAMYGIWRQWSRTLIILILVMHTLLTEIIIALSFTLQTLGLHSDQSYRL